MTSRLLVRFLAVLTISLGLVVPSAAGATAHDRKLPDRIALPNGFQPEGIDIGGEVRHISARGRMVPSIALTCAPSGARSSTRAGPAISP